MRGTWQTSSGGDAAPLALAAIAAAVLVGSGALTAAMAVLADLLLAVFIAAAVLVAAVCVAAVLVWRKHPRLPSVDQQIIAAQAVRAGQARAVPQCPAAAISAPQQHFHVHLHGTATSADAAAVLRAIPEGQQR